MCRLIFTFIFLSNTLICFAGDGIQVVGKPIKLIGGEGDIFMQPRWSPNGLLIAFTGSNYRGLWIINPDGSGVRQITDEIAAGFGFEWSSDSKAIVSRIAKFDGKFRYNAIRIFDLEGNVSKLVTDYRTLMPGLPHWADGDEKIFMFNRDKLEIFESGKTTPALQKQLSNKQIFFLKNDHIAIGNIETKAYEVYEPIKNSRYINMAVSPDQLKVVFEIIGGNLYVMNVDGTQLVDLGKGHRAQWAPDSKHLVYMITNDDGYRYLSSDLYVISIDGAEKTQVTNTNDKLEMNPSWSPDGKKIAFDAINEGTIYIIEIEQ